MKFDVVFSFRRIVIPVLSHGFNLIAFCLILAAMAGSGSRAFAVIPSNDLCAGAEMVPPSGPFPWSSTIVADISEATITGDPGEPSCLPAVSRSVWYGFTPVETAIYRLSFSGDTATTVFDTVMAVYASTNGCAGPFVEVACNDDSGLDGDHLQKSAVALMLDAGTTYYAVVWILGDLPPDPGSTAVQLRVSKASIPANDHCSGAMVIPGAASFPYLTPTIDTLLATESNDPPLPTCRVRFYARRSVWFEFTPEMTSSYVITTCQGTETRIFDTVMGLYTSENGCNGPFTEVGCNDAGCADRAEISQMLEAGTTYYIVVWDTEEEALVPETELQLRVALPPAAITLPATSITSTGAVLHGIVQANSTRRTWYYFEWGTDTDYTMPRTDLEFLFLGSLENISYSFPLTGLSPDTTYHYRLVVTNNSNEMAFGADQSFMWNSTPPLLAGEVIPAEGEGSFEFQFIAQADQVYFVEASTNFTNWSYVGQASNWGDGTFSFTDTNSPPLPKRFYRLNVP